MFAEATFVGAKTCATCHSDETNAWRQSDHYRSMLPATADTVLGSFENTEFTAGNRTTRFFKNQNDYYIETPNDDGESQIFEVKYTFGFNPLQQYLLKTERGRLQAFDIAWDNRSEAEGGQRWYQLQDNTVTDPEHPFFWTGYYQNWNSRCASCHSTNLEKHYDPAMQQFSTTYSDVNVACESCHGPGSDHIDLVKSRQVSAETHGLKELGKQIAFHFTPGDPIARPTEPADSELVLDTCGGCHSRRGEISEPTVDLDYHDLYQLEFLRDQLYFSDGQIRDEVFVLGSFLQSKMARAGVTCSHCHDPHTNKLRLPEAQICSTCHLPSVFASESHTNNHADANCLDCHMPQRTYMQIDERRDHRFHRPSTLHPNSASVCQSCHVGETQAWFDKALKAWPKRNGASYDLSGQWAKLNRGLTEQPASMLPEAVAFVSESALPSLQRIALLEKVAVAAPDEAVEGVLSMVKDDDPMARRGAAQIALSLPPAPQRTILLSLIDDPVTAVRAEVANSILALPVEAFTGAKVEALLSEYQQILSNSLDHPGPNLGIAQLALRRGDADTAGKAYERAISIAPDLVSARLSYADFLRNTGNMAQARLQLEKALVIAPELAGVQFAFALQKIRDKQYEQALPYLQRAAVGDDATGHFAFVYAVALWQTGQRDSALTTLVDANERWPRYYDILVTGAKYSYQVRNVRQFQLFLNELSEYYPKDQATQQLQQLTIN
ncbi:tetratricopeptide repeat protein [Alteromonas sp. ZYF713]|nr:tetratricopeptide repeat protein [Alteromonas sp. ZYF713]